MDPNAFLLAIFGLILERSEMRRITHTYYALTRAELLLAFLNNISKGCLVGVGRHLAVYINKEAAGCALHQHFVGIRRILQSIYLAGVVQVGLVNVGSKAVNQKDLDVGGEVGGGHFGCLVEIY
jgi:hypothetical protein